MTKVLLLAAVLIIIGVILSILKAKARGSAITPPEDADEAVDVTGYVKRRYLFSPAEYSFYKVLVLAVGDRCAILTKIRMADLIEVKKGTTGWQAKFNRIAKKHVDFVLCEPKTMTVLGVIELDDSSHDSDAQQKRDAFVDAVYGATGIPVLHVVAARDYQVQELKIQVDELTTTMAITQRPSPNVLR